MEKIICPKCKSEHHVKSGIVKNRQRYRCKDCNYFYTVDKIGKSIDSYYVIKALQLYIEGVTFREIERILGVSHVSVMNWVKKFAIEKPVNTEYHPTYHVLNHAELKELIDNRELIKSKGMLITELGDKYMVIKWERFKS